MSPLLNSNSAADIARAPILVPHAINQRWSLDFVSDTLRDGRRFRILCVVDDFSHECLATMVDTSLGGVRVVRELERLATERAVPQEMISDNGTELTGGAVLHWTTGRLAWALHRAWQAGTERFHRELQ
jgi:putative transposase